MKEILFLLNKNLIKGVYIIIFFELIIFLFISDLKKKILILNMRITLFLNSAIK